MNKLNKHILAISFLVTAIFYGNNLSFAQSADDGKILERTKYVFPVFEKAKGIEKLYSKAEYEHAINDRKFEMERLTYSSDGLELVAYLYQPTQAKNNKFPTIIFNRGGYIRGDIGYELAPLFHRLASEGFVVIAPLYRASNGTKGKDEVGGSDVNDLMNILPLARSLEFVDTNNLFMYGESRGGMMTFQALRNGFPVNAAATFGAFTDFQMLINNQPKLYEPLIKAIWSDFETRKEVIIKQRSAVFWADKINVPVLLMHGGADNSVDPMQTLNLAQLLQKLNKSYELVIYNGDNHILSKNQKDRDARAIAWFKKHIK